MKKSIVLISEERKRQIEKYGYDAVNDLKYDNNELVLAAISYATPESHRVYDLEQNGTYKKSESKPKTWLFKEEYWKPTPEDRIRELVKAGALICAEIDRLNNL